MDLTQTQQLIAEECDRIKNLLLEKNRKYGNSALEPARIFSKASPTEQLLVRIDDKLNRIRTTGPAAQLDEDTVQDLIGYLVLYRVACIAPTLKQQALPFGATEAPSLEDYTKLQEILKNQPLPSLLPPGGLKFPPGCICDVKY